MDVALQFWYVDDFLKSRDPGYEDIGMVGGAGGGGEAEQLAGMGGGDLSLMSGGLSPGAAAAAAGAGYLARKRAAREMLPGQTRFGWSKQEQDGGQVASL